MGKIRLTETQLRSMIAESVRNVLREYDEPFPYDYKDAREREAYFQRAAQNDFPMDGRYKLGRTWEDTYYSLLDKKQAADKERQKTDKLNARDERKKAELDRKTNAEKVRNQRNMRWARVVKDVFTGSDDENDDYDGISSFPLVMKDGSTVMFDAHSFMEVDDEFANQDTGNFHGYGSQEYDGFSFGLAGTVDGLGEDIKLYMTVGTYVSPMTLEVTNLQCSLEGINRLKTKIAITNLAKKEAIKRYRKI